jgi:hypothetical protein
MKLPDVVPQQGDANENRAPFAQMEGGSFDTAVMPVQPLFSPADSSALATVVPLVAPVPKDAVMPKQKRSLRWLGILLGIIGGLILAAYIGFSVFFMSHFMLNTTVNGVDVSFQSPDGVDAYLASEIEGYTLSIKAREAPDATVTAGEIGLRYRADGQMDGRVASQQVWAWPLALLPENSLAIQHVSMEFDAQKLNTKLNALPFMNTEQMRTPVDASLIFEGNAYAIDPGDEGTVLDTAKAETAVAEAIDAGLTTIDLDAEGLYALPAVPADDPTLIADRDTYNQFVPFQIIYTLGDRREVLDGKTALNWVDTSAGAGAPLSDDAVRAWIADFASRYDTLGSTRTIVNGFGEEKTVMGGTYGWQVDQEAEFWAIKEAFEQHRGEEREPLLSGWAASLGAQDWGTTYLEVDLTRQYMWYYVDGTCVLETDVITGNPNTGYATPEGVYFIFSKSLNVVTRGDPLPGGGYEWEVPVTYWMPFTYSGCGFHDAYWQSSFGGNAYLYRGSHGCINMPPSLAQELYSIVEVDTPVITHF